MRRLPSTRSGRRWISVHDHPAWLWLAMEMDDSHLSPFGPWSATTPGLPRGLILDLRMRCLSSLPLESGRIRILPGSAHRDTPFSANPTLQSLCRPGYLVLVLGAVSDRDMHPHLIEATAAAHRLGATVLVALHRDPSIPDRTKTEWLIERLAVHADRILLDEPARGDALQSGSALDLLAWALSAEFAPAMLDFILAPTQGPLYVDQAVGAGPAHRLDAIETVLDSRPNHHAAQGAFLALADGQYGDQQTARPRLVALRERIRQRLPPRCGLEVHHQPGHLFTGACTLAFMLMRMPSARVSCRPYASTPTPFY